MGAYNAAYVQDRYDRLAGQYARRLFHELDRKPLDRELLKCFAAAMAGRGEVCDIGCGPGQVARRLRDAGAEVFGLDLSPRMVEQARQLNPDIEFREGNLMSLPLEDAALAGMVAFYAIVHFSPEELPAIFAEMYRVLRAGGELLLAFHCGDGALHVQEMWGVAVFMDFFFFQPEELEEKLRAAGFSIVQTTEREPYAADVEHQSRRAYITAQK